MELSQTNLSSDVAHENSGKNQYSVKIEGLEINILETEHLHY